MIQSFTPAQKVCSAFAEVKFSPTLPRVCSCSPCVLRQAKAAKSHQIRSAASMHRCQPTVNVYTYTHTQTH